MYEQRISALLLTLNLFVTLSCFAQTETEKMDKVVQSYVDNQQFMGSVLVAQGDNIILNKGYGFANVEWEIPNTPATKFKLASITKQFTAASVLILEEQGKLKTSDFITKYFPDVPAAWNKITILNLLNHSSGIPDFTTFPNYESFQLSPTTASKTILTFKDMPLDFDAGQRVSYSSSGYILLGALIEKISGKSYESFVQDNIFSRVNMTNSGYASNTEIIIHQASGYTWGPIGVNNATYIDMSVPYAAGALYSTTGDLLKWENAVFGGKLLSSSSLKKMITPYKEDYALGVFVATNKGQAIVQHNGEINGFNTNLIYYLDKKITVAVLGNVNTYAVDEITNAIGAIAQGEDIKSSTVRKEIKISNEILKKYVGSYELSPSVNMIITLNGNHLISQVSNQQQTAPLFAETDARFFVKAFAAQIVFFENESQVVTHLVLHQGGNDKKALKKNN
ncbi:MAG: serine hydrolase [Gammaproteobacteria bacterium]|nr:MAG: serine hydrolase [Gammaproteobacteria bacterium]